MKNLLLALPFLVLLSGCKHKKPSLSGDEPVEVEDFIESFELINPPFELADSSLRKKDKDSLLISYKVFTLFVPDTVLTKVFGRNKKVKIYPLKRIEADNGEIYLFSKAVLADKRVSHILCFDKENKFAGAMPLLLQDANAATRQVSGMDKRYAIYKTTILRKADGSSVDGRDVYVFNPEAKQFMLIMTDALDDQVKEVINPIDTFPAKHKFSADYVKDKMNLVSVRDGLKPNKLTFFIHFEKNQGECTGELKGEASMIASNTAVYRQPGDLCALQLTFSSSSVTLKELEACGSRRGVKCSFDGSYPRKKVSKKKPKK